MVASLATAPFAVYHFNRIALYGLLANAIAVPVMAMWIMPFALVSLVMMPFGLESLGLVPMGWGIEIVLLVAEKVAALQGAIALIPPIPAIGISILALGRLVLCMTRGKLRIAGIPLVAAGMASIFVVTAPDVLINRDGSLVAINLGQGTVAMSPGRGKKFKRDI